MPRSRPTTIEATTHEMLLDETGSTRRSFLTKSAVIGAAALLPAGLIGAAAPSSVSSGMTSISDGDAAILRFLAAAELLETDAWQQYNELANGNPRYMRALEKIDGDMPAYVSQNTIDEFTHADFLNAFLVSQGRQPVNLDAFRTLPSSPATGADKIGRLTNLMHLNVDTSWYTRYRSAGNPDFGDTFPQIVDIANRPGIPLEDHYSNNQIQAIANTAALHFAMIEQGGTSLYDVMSLKTSDLLVLRIVTSIGGTEVAHFEIWNDKAGDIPAVDSGDGLVFPDLSANEQFPNNQVMPKPCRFISASLPLCSVMRPTSFPMVSAAAVVQFLTATGLFAGQSNGFFNTMTSLAAAADAAIRVC